MGLVLQLVETRADGGTRSVALRELGRPGNLRDITDLGLTLPEVSEAMVTLAAIRLMLHRLAPQSQAIARPITFKTGCKRRSRLMNRRSRPYRAAGVQSPARQADEALI